MTTKLTLTVEESLIEAAKVYARQRGERVSHLVEQYLRSLTTKDMKKEVIPPNVKKLMGVISLPDSFDYKTALKEAIASKHSK